MATVILDFDSTLITVESIEEILRPNMTPDLTRQLEEITDLGMNGAIDFHESLARRLALAAPTKQEVARFGKRAFSLLTPGMAPLVTDLLGRQVTVCIVSGGLIEAILPLAARLGLKPENIHAVQLDWASDGRCKGIAAGDPFARSKVAGCRPLVGSWARPVIAVGDGTTDWQLFEQGLADTFIAFTYNQRRPAVLAKAAQVAADCTELARILEQWL
jgi:phosphoserine phosphatase